MEHLRATVIWSGVDGDDISTDTPAPSWNSAPLILAIEWSDNEAATVTAATSKYYPPSESAIPSTSRAQCPLTGMYQSFCELLPSV